MKPIVIFSLVLVLQIVLLYYFKLKPLNGLIWKMNYVKTFKVVLPDYSDLFKRFSLYMPSHKKSNHDSKTSDADHELSMKLLNCKRQLRRNLMTLDYLNMLETNPKSLRLIYTDTDEFNLRKSLQLEIIRNTRLVKHYNSLMIS